MYLQIASAGFNISHLVCGSPNSLCQLPVMTIMIKKIGVLSDTARATTTSQPTNRAPNEPAKIHLGTLFEFVFGRTLDKMCKKWQYLAQNRHFCPLLAHLVGWLVVVARGLYLARHLFTLYILTANLRLYHLLGQNQYPQPKKGAR